MFIHAVYPSITASSSSFASNRIAFPPSPPQSPPKQHYLSSSPTKHLNSLMWQSTWHVVQSMASSHHDNTNDHNVVLLDTHQPVPYIINTLDPVFHGRSSIQHDTPEKHKATTAAGVSSSRSIDHFRQFVKLNEKFADQIVERYHSDDDIILIHDYSLILLPGMLRQRLPQATIAIVISNRFPVLDSRLSEHRHLIQSMLVADLVAFQMQRDIDTFIASARGPVPFCCLIKPTAHVIRSIHNSSPSNKTTILCHNIDNHPSLFPVIQQSAINNNDSIFIYIATQLPTSTVTTTANNIRIINHHTMTTEEYSNLLATADVALIMGHDTTATIAAQAFLTTNTKNAPLVVSPDTPLEQHASLVIDAAKNPDAISRALTQPLPPRPQFVNDTRMTTTQLANRLGSGEFKHKTPLLNVNLMTRAYQDAQRRLFLFDYDGTLTPIVSNPDDAKPTPALLDHLQTLCNDPRNTVWVVSGRDQATLESWLGKHVHGLGLSAEHGSFMKQPECEWINMLAQHGDSMAAWQSTALDVFQRFTTETPGTVVEQKKASITWHYRNALDPQHALAQCEACYQALQQAIDPSVVDILRGKMNLEVRSRLVNKGNVVSRIKQSVDPDWILCAGDDRTDEDMFNALPHASAWCVHIGPQEKETAANWSISSSEQFVDCIGQLSAHKTMNRPAL
ncbi:hypothetical protein K492DRAFT_143065 [Lichtheimia hyalospora FSU 10163]|nr:hypothetical protein K492DRAFT_143065 [Lichtheimia hyalospora FSU 10163]